MTIGQLILKYIEENKNSFSTKDCLKFMGLDCDNHMYNYAGNIFMGALYIIIEMQKEIKHLKTISSEMKHEN